MKTYEPEKLNIYDRIFNRYKTIPVENGKEEWTKRPNCFIREFDYNFTREFVVYHDIDRLTGSYTIRKEYLN